MTTRETGWVRPCKLESINFDISQLKPGDEVAVIVPRGEIDHVVVDVVARVTKGGAVVLATGRRFEADGVARDRPYFPAARRERVVMLTHALKLASARTALILRLESRIGDWRLLPTWILGSIERKLIFDEDHAAFMRSCENDDDDDA